MRHALTTLAFLVLALPAAAQQVRYVVDEDDPGLMTRQWIGVEPMYVDAGMDNIDGAQIGAGVSGLFEFGRIAAEGAVRIAYFTFEDQGSAYQFEGGGRFTLLRQDRTTDITVLLEYSESTFVNTRTVRTRTIEVPGMQRRNYFVRGGVYGRRSAYSTDGITVASAESALSHSGLYAGIGGDQGHYMQLRLNDNDGQGVYPFPTSSLIGLYADVLLLKGTLDNDLLSGVEDDGMGWRAGLYWHLTPVPSSRIRASRGFFATLISNMNAKMEVGDRPFEGTYVMATIAFPVFER